MSNVTVQCPPCIVCGTASVMTLSSVGVENYKQGMFVQQAFPELSAPEREVLISGTHPECWDRLFA